MVEAAMCSVDACDRVGFYIFYMYTHASIHSHAIVEKPIKLIQHGEFIKGTSSPSGRTDAAAVSSFSV